MQPFDIFSIATFCCLCSLLCQGKTPSSRTYSFNKGAGIAGAQSELEKGASSDPFEQLALFLVRFGKGNDIQRYPVPEIRNALSTLAKSQSAFKSMDGATHQFRNALKESSSLGSRYDRFIDSKRKGKKHMKEAAKIYEYTRTVERGLQATEIIQSVQESDSAVRKQLLSAAGLTEVRRVPVSANKVTCIVSVLRPEKVVHIIEGEDGRDVYDGKAGELPASAATTAASGGGTESVTSSAGLPTASRDDTRRERAEQRRLASQPQRYLPGELIIVVAEDSRRATTRIAQLLRMMGCEPAVNATLADAVSLGDAPPSSNGDHGGTKRNQMLEKDSRVRRNNRRALARDKKSTSTKTSDTENDFAATTTVSVQPTLLGLAQQMIVAVSDFILPLPTGLDIDTSFSGHRPATDEDPVPTYFAADLPPAVPVHSTPSKSTRANAKSYKSDGIEVKALHSCKRSQRARRRVSGSKDKHHRTTEWTEHVVRGAIEQDGETGKAAGKVTGATGKAVGRVQRSRSAAKTSSIRTTAANFGSVLAQTNAKMDQILIASSKKPAADKPLRTSGKRPPPTTSRAPVSLGTEELDHATIIDASKPFRQTAFDRAAAAATGRSRQKGSIYSKEGESVESRDGDENEAEAAAVCYARSGDRLPERIRIIGHSAGGAVGAIAAMILDGSIGTTSTTIRAEAEAKAGDRGSYNHVESSSSAPYSSIESGRSAQSVQSVQTVLSAAAGAYSSRVQCLALGPPPCVSRAQVPKFVSSIVCGDDLVPRAQLPALQNLLKRTEKALKSGAGKTGAGKLGYVLGAGFISDFSAVAGKGLSHYRGAKKFSNDAKGLNIPGRVFFIKPRKLKEGATIQRVLRGNWQEDMLWQLHDVLLSKRMLEHHSLDSYIRTLNRC